MWLSGFHHPRPCMRMPQFMSNFCQTFAATLLGPARLCPLPGARQAARLHRRGASARRGRCASPLSADQSPAMFAGLQLKRKLEEALSSRDDVTPRCAGLPR